VEPGLKKVFRGEIQVIVGKSGFPVAAIISGESLKGVTRFEEERAMQFKVLGEIGKALAAEFPLMPPPNSWYNLGV